MYENTGVPLLVYVLVHIDTWEYIVKKSPEKGECVYAFTDKIDAMAWRFDSRLDDFCDIVPMRPCELPFEHMMLDQVPVPL